MINKVLSNFTLNIKTKERTTYNLKLKKRKTQNVTLQLTVINVRNIIKRIDRKNRTIKKTTKNVVNVKQYDNRKKVEKNKKSLFKNKTMRTRFNFRYAKHNEKRLIKEKRKNLLKLSAKV